MKQTEHHRTRHNGDPLTVHMHPVDQDLPEDELFHNRCDDDRYQDALHKPHVHEDILDRIVGMEPEIVRQKPVEQKGDDVARIHHKNADRKNDRQVLP